MVKGSSKNGDARFELASHVSDHKTWVVCNIRQRQESHEQCVHTQEESLVDRDRATPAIGELNGTVYTTGASATDSQRELTGQ